MIHVPNVKYIKWVCQMERLPRTAWMHSKAIKHLEATGIVLQLVGLTHSLAVQLTLRGGNQ